MKNIKLSMILLSLLGASLSACNSGAHSTTPTNANTNSLQRASYVGWYLEIRNNTSTPIRIKPAGNDYWNQYDLDTCKDFGGCIIQPHSLQRFYSENSTLSGAIQGIDIEHQINGKYVFIDHLELVYNHSHRDFVNELGDRDVKMGVTVGGLNLLKFSRAEDGDTTRAIVSVGNPANKAIECSANNVGEIIKPAIGSNLLVVENGYGQNGIKNPTNLSNLEAGKVRFCTSHVTDMSKLFSGSKFNQQIGDWDTRYVNNMSQMFYHATEFDVNIGSWDTSTVNNMSQMFFNTKTFNQNLSSWNVSNVVDHDGFSSEANPMWSETFQPRWKN